MRAVGVPASGVLSVGLAAHRLLTKAAKTRGPVCTTGGTGVAGPFDALEVKLGAAEGQTQAEAQVAVQIEEEGEGEVGPEARRSRGQMRLLAAALGQLATEIKGKRKAAAAQATAAQPAAQPAAPAAGAAAAAASAAAAAGAGGSSGLGAAAGGGTGAAGGAASGAAGVTLGALERVGLDQAGRLAGLEESLRSELEMGR